MKNYCYLNFLLLFTLSLSLQCRKPKSELEKLPPATQTGADKFGCLIDGKAFLPKGNPFGGPILSCAYQFVNGGYYFQLKAFNNEGAVKYGVGVFTDSLNIENGIKYTLKNRFTKAQASGIYSISNFGLVNYLTNDINTGELKISKFDRINRIVSGTFWFDAIDKQGQKVEVREGRFDLKYTL